MKFYKAENTKISVIFLLGVITLIWLALGIWSLIDDHYFANNAFTIPMSWILFGLSLIYIFMLIFIPRFLNKHKHQIANFRNENWSELIQELKSQKHERTAIIIKKHARYYSIIKQKYDFVMLMLDKYNSTQFERFLTDIILFNDMHTTKWSKNYNNVQLLMFYEMCLKLQQKAS
jgi:hypothetical protein